MEEENGAWEGTLMPFYTLRKEKAAAQLVDK
ncbi:hypothetical protein A2U01_0110354, partial [Trifolium medium]|nr:hypothetical protein [Trifolium medium]